MNATARGRPGMKGVGVRGDTWIALDFETATSERSSACSLGIAVIEGDAVTDSVGWLIQPPYNVYDGRNISVHRITPSMTEDAPTFADVYPELLRYLEGQRIIAHWAAFDVSVLRAAIGLYHLPMPATRYVCSCRMAQRAFPALHNHQLPTVCEHCGIALEHHDAVSDAHAAALVALHCGRAVGVSSVGDAVDKLGVSVGLL